MDCGKEPTPQGAVAPDIFNQRVETARERIRPGEYALVALDFDNFNFINDLLGYEIGNVLLRRIEEHFSQRMREGEFCSRTRADHFLFWLRDPRAPALPLERHLAKLADVRESLSAILPPHYTLVCAGGIVPVADTQEDIPSLLDKANFARKQAKGNYGNTFLRYDAKMAEEIKWRKRITLSAEAALRNGEFEMYLQPKILLGTGETAGAEALVRWNSQEYGMIPPSRFIPVLEQTGFVRELDFCMLDQACSFLAACTSRGLPVLPISVNFSRVHIGSGTFPERVFHTTERHGIPASLVEVELTESVFSDDFLTMGTIVGQLKHFGFRIALDDFGSAYSSLNHLKDIPLDVVKIDQGFLSTTGDGDKGGIIIAKMLEMIKSLHLASVMEGVATREQAELLRQAGCDYGQGNYFSRALTVAAYERFIMDNGKGQFPSARTEDAASTGQADDTEEGARQSGRSSRSSVRRKIAKTKTQVLEESLHGKIEELERLFQAERENREALRLSEERHRLILGLSDDIVFEWDFATDSIEFSEKYSETFGQEAIHDHISDNAAIRSRIHPEDREIFEDWVRNTYRKPGISKAEYRLSTADGRHLWVRAHSIAINDEHGVPIRAVGVLANIHKQKLEMNSLTIKSQLDPLMQLYNKEESRKRIETYLAARPDAMGAFFIVDVDNFKGLNDSLGHQFGDTVLQEVAEKLRALFRGTDILGRLGGDEISIFMHDVKSKADVLRKADQLSASLRRTYFGASAKYHISGSVGIAYYPEHGVTFEELYRTADAALYQSKRRGKDCYTVYRDTLAAAMPEQMASARTPVEESGRFLGTYFSGDPIFSVFQMLYETRDIHTTIQLLLEHLGTRFEVDRGYVFEHSEDGRFSSNTYEWCAPGVAAVKDSLQNVPMEELEVFLGEYNAEGILCRSDLHGMHPLSRSVLEKQGIQSLLHCAIHNEGRITGFIGFDSCRKQRIWRGEEIAVLGYISRVLSVFLAKTHIKQELLDSYANHVEMLDNFNGYVYVVDAKTHETLYINNMLKEMGITLGEKCYAAAFGEKEPCPFCQIPKLSEATPHASDELYSTRLRHWINVSASRLKWTGNRDAALFCCTLIGGANPDIPPPGNVTRA